MLLFQAIVLGILQGLTEFLPVSSSGHLQAVPYLLGWEQGGSLAFDVLVHTGTLAAVIWHFRSDLGRLFRNTLGRGVGPELRRQAWLLVGLLALGSVPAAAAGVLFADVFEVAFSSPRLVALFLYVTAVLLWGAERIRTARLSTATVPRGGTAEPDVVDSGSLGRGMDSLRARDAIAIGLAQAFAIFPGVSRSGATIATAMALGLSRTEAARFSFLLAIPIILGATLVTIPDMGALQPGTLPFGTTEMVVGALAAALSGYWAIRTLLAVVARRDLLGFARYVTVFGTVLLLATFLRG